ncbi:apolipoprotein D-like [Homalodisca vitripennis]|uniref:apolipoprotein D-like n=1 Tax=Homalodisca vitripennis TaxID=197043 RepID=UPI001EEA46E2|nr:apolipoprotein D-like [Homalodisca vitripennis]
MIVVYSVLWSCLQAGLAHAQYIAVGGCPNVTVKHPFNLVEYMGTWYQKETYGTELFQGTGKCVTAMYSLNPNTGVVDVFNSQEPVSSSSTARSINGTAVLEDSNKMEGKLLVTFPIPIIQRITSKYWVLDTDYSNWAVVWSCFSLGSLAHSESAWILVRHRDGAKEDNDNRDLEIDSVLKREGIPRSRFKKTDQENCLMQ